MSDPWREYYNAILDFGVSSTSILPDQKKSDLFKILMVFKYFWFIRKKKTESRVEYKDQGNIEKV